MLTKGQRTKQRGALRVMNDNYLLDAVVLNKRKSAKTCSRTIIAKQLLNN